MLNKDTFTDMVKGILTDDRDDFTDPDIFVTEVKVSADNKLTVNIDSIKGISVNDCATLSRKIESELDREQEDFELIVSSAGLDQPFKVLKQYEKNIGKEIKVLGTDGKRYKGKLTKVTSDEIELLIAKKKDKHSTSEQIMKLDMVNIKEAKVVITF
jgi:ribosome maturation factor RimP